eukprot:485546-Heterocapsa_arctica.AAC.1
MELEHALNYNDAAMVWRNPRILAGLPGYVRYTGPPPADPISKEEWDQFMADVVPAASSEPPVTTREAPLPFYV